MSSNNMPNCPLRADGRRPSEFLSLAPTTSSSYPSQKTTTSPPKTPEQTAVKLDNKSTTVPLHENAVDDSEPATESDVLHRRTSSTGTTSSSGSTSGPSKFLTLGPVHWGEHEAGKGDWSVAEE